MKRRSLLPLLLVAGLLAGCAGLPFDLASPAETGTGTPEADGTAAPLFQPTLSTGGFAVVPSPACLVRTQTVLQAEPQSGDLVDWEPGGSRLAYLGPAVNTSWHLGDVLLLDVTEEASNPVPAAGNAAGQLHWLADGRLILESYRSIDTVYTVITVQPDGSQQTDLFPGTAAHIDSFSSPKAILNNEDGSLTILAVCGLDCLQAFELNGARLEPMAQWTALEGRSAWLPSISTYQPPEGEYPAMYQANWTADRSRAVYYDGESNLWVMDLAQQELFALGVPENPLETDWSDDGRYLAVRGGGELKIFELECARQAEPAR